MQRDRPLPRARDPDAADGQAVRPQRHRRAVRAARSHGRLLVRGNGPRPAQVHEERRLPGKLNLNQRCIFEKHFRILFF